MAAITGTGLLAASSATLTGVGVLGHVGVGVLNAGAADIVSVGVLGHVSTSAVLAADAAVMGCAATTIRSGTGNLVAGLATLSGVGYNGPFAHLEAGPATLTAVGYVSVTVIAVLVADPATLTAVGTVDTPDTGYLEASPATLSAVGIVGHVGVGYLVVEFATIIAVTEKVTSITGSVPVPIVPTGTIGAAVTGFVPVPIIPTGFLNNVNYLSGTVPVGIIPLGSLTYQAGPSASLESEYENTGIRTSVPTLVYLLDGTLLNQLTVVPTDRSFLVPPYFVSQLADPFSEAGAGPDYIGTKKVDTLGAIYVVFRKPILNEVVWYVPGNILFRYEYSRDSKLYGWKKYVSLPQRAIDGQSVFSMFDPERVYDYYGVVWGGLMWRWTYDTFVISQQADPDRCASFYLGALAAQWGYDLPADESLASRRALTRNAVPSFKFKGLVAAVRLKLQALGYRGYVNEIWVNPDNPANNSYRPLVPLNAAGESSASLDGAGLDYIERPHGYDSVEPTTYWPSSRMALHLNDQDGAPIDFAVFPEKVQRALAVLRRDTLPAHVDIRYLVTDVNVLGVDEAEDIGVSDALTILDANVLGDGALVASGASLLAFGTVT